MLTVNELFAGIGSQRAALERLGIEHKVVGIAEIDKFAIKSYEAIWGKTKNYGDISKVDKLDYADFWTYSFPCQDISVAGKQAGIKKGKTRSGLLYEVERLLEVAQEHNELPKYLMLENVKNLVGKKFKPKFEEWILRLDELGYNTYWQVLNAKNYGIPQNRERVFGISIRKDIDTGYVFPEPFELKTRLKDILEDEVDEKYYLNEEQIKRLKGNTFNSANRRLQEKEYSDTLLARDYKDPKVIQVARYDTPTRINSSRYRTYSKEGISPTLTSMGGGNLEPHIFESIVCEQRTDEGLRFFKGGVCGALRTIDACGDKRVLIPQATKKGYIECNVPGVADLSYSDSKTRRGRVQEDGEICPTLMAGQQDICYIDTPCIAASRGRNPDNPSDRTAGSPTEQRLEINQNGTSNTITTVQKDNYVLEKIVCEQRTDEGLRFFKGGVVGTLRTIDSCGDKRVLEPNVLTPKRTEYGKAIRKDYENGLISESRHNMTEMQPREDGISNTLTTVQKDNYVIGPQYRIRKLTPKECWRLMGFTDEQFQKAQDAGVSNTQLYKQAGNSIVVDVLYYIFRNLFIEKPKYRVQVDSEEQIPGQASILDFM